jgi:hypothetical protein
MFHDPKNAPKNDPRNPITTAPYKYLVFEDTPTPPIFSLVTTINLLSASSSHGMQAKINMKMCTEQAAF